MKSKWLCLLLILPVVMTACCTAPETRHTNENLNGTLWMQTSAEYKMLTSQAYLLARASTEKALADPDWSAATEQIGENFQGLPPAIIVDVDETVLDTTAFQAQLIINKSQFSVPLWNDWVKTSSAESIPGARDFLQWAAGNKKIAVFYITNRDVSVETYTRNNLLDEGFPVTESMDVILSKGEYGDPSSDKSARRRHVCKDYRVLLMAGDNLGDFIGGAENTPENRVTAAGVYASFWANKWIVLPNPLYGSWEGAIYDHNRHLTDQEILNKKFEHLRGYK